MTVTPEEMLADDWVDGPPLAHRSAARDDAGAGRCARRRHRVPLRLRCRRHARQPHPVELLVVRLRCARARMGDQPQQPRLVVHARSDARSTRSAPVEAPDAHTHPGHGDARTARPGVVFGSMGGDSQAQIQVQLLAHLVERRHRSAGCARRASLVHRTVELDVAGRRRHFPDGWFDALRARGHDPQRAPRIDTGMGHAHAIQRTAGGYAVATEPRAEGAALGL